MATRLEDLYPHGHRTIVGGRQISWGPVHLEEEEFPDPESPVVGGGPAPHTKGDAQVEKDELAAGVPDGRALTLCLWADDSG